MDKETLKKANMIAKGIDDLTNMRLDWSQVMHDSKEINPDKLRLFWCKWEFADGCQNLMKVMTKTIFAAGLKLIDSDIAELEKEFKKL